MGLDGFRWVEMGGDVKKPRCLVVVGNQSTRCFPQTKMTQQHQVSQEDVSALGYSGLAFAVMDA